MKGERSEMTLGSLFSGSGGFELAGVMNGIEPRWLSEIEPFPCRVTAARFPGVPNLGDVRGIDGTKIEPVDIITFGSPCQDLSIAGKKAGIYDGERSSLFFEAIRIIKEMRDATADEFPRFAVWENVTGAFSSNKGEDFRAVLDAFVQNWGGVTVPRPESGKWEPAGCIVGDGYSVAWRVYTAHYWGVPQRRKRIYLIADLGSERAGEILFKPDGVCRSPETDGGATQRNSSGDVSGSAECLLTVARCLSMSEYIIDGTTSTLKARDYKGGAVDYVIEKKEKYRVRRLTPEESARLQGFPDGWCDGVDGSDTAKYKMFGNAVAIPCAADVLGRIAKELRKDNAR